MGFPWPMDCTNRQWSPIFSQLPDLRHSAGFISFRFIHWQNITQHRSESMESPVPVVRERFWSRQFSTTITSRQKIFDLVVGVVIPILLVIFDPVVFRSTGACVGPVL